jgi:superfamily II DNA or RNA helicase
MLAEHQRSAATRARQVLLERRGLILADEVGLGKSFVGAAVMRDFLDDGASVELIVPASLVPQWRETLARFAVFAKVTTHDGLLTETALADDRQRLVVVDEAHAFRNRATKRYEALARRSIGARLMLITATPICNAIEDLRAIVDLIAPDDLLADRGVPSIDLAFEKRDRQWIDIILAELMIRRDHGVLPPSLQFGSLDRKVVRHEVFDARGIDALRFPLVGANALLRRFLWRRLESSEAALLESIRRQLRFYTRALDSLSRGVALDKREYRRAFGREEDRDAFQQVLFWELWAPASPSAIDPRTIEEEMAALEQLRRDVEQSPRTKRAQLAAILEKANEPVLIFTSSVATARDLHATFRMQHRCGIATSREREDAAVAYERFRGGALDVLVATDMASEGLNLQRAGIVIHYDLPWNPVKLDQRNGRAYRIGQQRESVKAIYFVPKDGHTHIVNVIAGKNRDRRRTLNRRSAVRDPRSLLLPPRLTRAAAAARMIAAIERRGMRPPEAIERRHKAGLERLIATMTGEYLDATRLAYLFIALDLEMHVTPPAATASI